MPLASLANLHWNGPAAGAAVGTAPAITSAVQIKATARGGSVITALATSALAKATRLVNSPAIATALATAALALPKARARITSVGRIGALSQDDVTGAVLEAQVEGGLTLKQVLRLLLAQAGGNATGLDGGTIAFKSLDGSKTRLGGTIAAGTRTITARDAE
jgi:hypothetical protein